VTHREKKEATMTTETQEQARRRRVLRKAYRVNARTGKTTHEILREWGEPGVRAREFDGNKFIWSGTGGLCGAPEGWRERKIHAAADPQQLRAREAVTSRR